MDYYQELYFIDFKLTHYQKTGKLDNHLSDLIYYS